MNSTWKELPRGVPQGYVLGPLVLNGILYFLMALDWYLEHLLNCD